jgi:hypothetical protein
MLGPSRSSNLNPNAASFIPGAATPAPAPSRPTLAPLSIPTSARPSTPSPGGPPSPNGMATPNSAEWKAKPSYDPKAFAQFEAIHHYDGLPEAGFQKMWQNGCLPVFPTSERQPTARETQVLQDFAAQINTHRDANLPVSLLPDTTRLHRIDPYRKGEYGAAYGPGQGGALDRQDFRFEPGQAVNPATRPDTKMVVHSHPIQRFPPPQELDDLVVRMPSHTDHMAAADDKATTNADNYLVYGDRVSHFDGRSLNVTELNPSPLQGRLPPA